MCIKSPNPKFLTQQFHPFQRFFPILPSSPRSAPHNYLSYPLCPRSQPATRKRSFMPRLHKMPRGIWRSKILPMTYQTRTIWPYEPRYMFFKSVLKQTPHPFTTCNTFQIPIWPLLIPLILLTLIHIQTILLPSCTSFLDEVTKYHSNKGLYVCSL